MAETIYYRCSHCRGFYEAELGACKYCRYTTIVCNADGSPKKFAGRDVCRAIQIAEYEQLPPEAMEDCFKPAKDELAEVCACLHCGRDGPLFEAVEMRWIVNEQMWACPCTTCGGRGFGMDIHPITPRWECNECGHKWLPPGGNSKPSNCKCPKCGCTEASGWFDDEYSEENIARMTDEEYVKAFGKTREEEEREYREFNARFEKEQEERRPAGKPPYGDDDPFGPEDEAEEEEDFAAYDPEARRGEAGEDPPASGEPPMADDIDFPRPGISKKDGPPLGEDDIPY